MLATRIVGPLRSVDARQAAGSQPSCQRFAAVPAARKSTMYGYSASVDPMTHGESPFASSWAPLALTAVMSGSASMCWPCWRRKSW